MRGNGSWQRRLWLAAAWWAVFALPATLRADEPSASPSAPAAPPVLLFLKEPADLTGLLKQLRQPDFVILRGDEYARLAPRPAARTPDAPWAYSVDSVAVSGSIAKGVADLSVEVGAVLTVDGPVWVDLRLDGLNLTGVAEQGKPLDVRLVEGKRWQAEVSGRGKHALLARLLAPTRLAPDGERIELAIPEAASTRMAVDVSAKVVAAETGQEEPVASRFDGEARRTRLQAELTPRPMLVLSWRGEEDGSAALPPLLVAQEEIALDVDTGWLRARASWSIRSVRGAAASLQIQLDPDDELLEVELDGQTPPAAIDRSGGVVRLTIPLPEPLAPGRERRLVMNTRRPMPAGPTAKMDFRGFPLTNAREQTGVVSIAVPGYLWLGGDVRRGLRAIDPRTELPTDLRARPSTALAYQFSEQPFELRLRVEPSPPLIRAETRSTLVLNPSSAQLDAWVDFQAARGRLGDLHIGLPPGLDVDAVGPDDRVEAWQISPIATALIPGAAAGGLRILTVRLSAKGREGGRVSIRVAGREAFDARSRDASIALVQPIGVVSEGGRIAVLTDPAITAELADRGDAAAGVGAFRPAVQSPPADWPWPAGRAPAGPPPLWLRYDDRPVDLPLIVSAHPRTLTQSTLLRVRVDRDSVDVQQETECTVQFGVIDHLDLSVPIELLDRWELDAAGIAQRIDLGMNSEGRRSVRLRLASDAARSARLKMRYRLPVAAAETSVPWLRVQGVNGPDVVHALLSAGPDVSVDLPPGAWLPDPMHMTTLDENTQALGLAAPDGPSGEPLRLLVAPRKLADLPRVVVPRLALQTIQDPQGDLHTIARYRVETDQNAFAFTLPKGANLLRVRVGGEAIAQVEELAEGAGYRAPFPVGLDAGATLVELEYNVPAAAAAVAWSPPRVLGAEVVQQTFWEIRVPWNRAVVGVPAGWTDENEWYWDNYVWKRQPWLSSSALSAWVRGEPAAGRGAAAGDADARNGYHGYLFGRPGGPNELAVTTASRALLVAVCSGSVLALGGLLILAWRPAIGLAGVAVIGLGAAVASLLYPSVVLQVLQSSLIGVALTTMILVLHRLVEPRPPEATIYADSAANRAAVVAAAAAGSTMTHTLGVGAGSDESTLVRAKSASTRDHFQVAPPPSTGETGPRGVDLAP